MSGLLLSLAACQVFSTRSHYANYFRPSFICNSDPIWPELDKFEKYKPMWEIIRAQYNQKNAEIKSIPTVIAGNSLVHLFTDAAIQKEFPNKDVVARGIGGDTTYTFLERIDDNVLSLNPNTVVLEIGGNDLIQGKCLDFIESNILKIVQKIKSKNPNTKIIFLSVPPTTRPELNSIAPVLNSFLYKLSREDKNILYADTWNEMRDSSAPRIRPELIRLGDPIHFNEKGYEIWGKNIRPLLK